MKERLTGAIILVALIVLLVPELLTGPVRSAPRSVAVASSAEEPPLRSYTINLADEAHTRDAASRSGPEQPAPLAAAPSPATSTPAEEGTTGSTPAPASPPASGSPSASGSGSGSSAVPSAPAPPAHPTAALSPTRPASAAGAAEPMSGYVVQLGSFASRANAERLAKQVHAQGFIVSVSQGSSGHLYRVRVGPAHDRAGAAELAQQLHARGHDGKIVSQ